MSLSSAGEGRIPEPAGASRSSSSTSPLWRPSPRQRAAMVLRDVIGRSAAETAKQLDLTVAAANRVGQQARATLRDACSERLEWSSSRWAEMDQPGQVRASPPRAGQAWPRCCRPPGRHRRGARARVGRWELGSPPPTPRPASPAELWVPVRRLSVRCQRWTASSSVHSVLDRRVTGKVGSYGLHVAK
jgi:hypothetical protein